MADDAKKPAEAKDAKRPHLTLVSTKENDDPWGNSELVGFFQAFEEALMKEVEAILNL